jgi:guanylate kinase
MRQRPVVLVLHGPSGVGKDAVLAELLPRTGFVKPVSTTTRKPRPGEIDGIHYHFLTREAFEERIACGDMVEWAEVFQRGDPPIANLYGLQRDDVMPLIEAGRDIVIRTDVQGARTWRKRLAGAVTVLLMAEDREALRARLIARELENHNGNPDPEDLAARIAEVEAYIADEPHNDYVVLNHHGRLLDAVTEIEEIISRERANPDRPYPQLRA